jgi:Protein of unknown function (DUF1236)
MRFGLPTCWFALFGAALIVATANAQTGQVPDSAGPVQNPGSVSGDTQPAGNEPPSDPRPTDGATRDTIPSPIGATRETMPSKFNPDVAVHDRIPIMARPPALTDEQKRHIYDSVMENAHIPITQTTAEPGTVLPGSVELSDLDPSVTDQIPVVRGYKYVKLQDKLLIVSPSNRIVVGEVFASHR